MQTAGYCTTYEPSVIQNRSVAQNLNRGNRLDSTSDQLKKTNSSVSYNTPVQRMVDFSGISSYAIGIGISLFALASLALYYSYNQIKNAVMWCYNSNQHGEAALRERLDYSEASSSSSSYSANAGGSDEKHSSEEVAPTRTLRRRRGAKVSSLSVYMFGYPDYNGTTYGGGTHSSFILGPNSYVVRGTDADSKKPGVIEKAREDLGIPFVAGHLLNADFQGDGTISKNLTALSPSGNGNHKGFDNPIKEAAGLLRRIYDVLYQEGVDITDVGLGISLDIKVSGGKWSNVTPGKYITKALTCTAKVHGKLSAAQMRIVGDLYEVMVEKIGEARKNVPNPGY
ncbi:MAG: hypothetical protein RIM99_20430 [Cyclobacteriaceae bacterium]